MASAEGEPANTASMPCELVQVLALLGTDLLSGQLHLASSIGTCGLDRGGFISRDSKPSLSCWIVISMLSTSCCGFDLLL